VTPRLLVTTALEETWGRDEALTYAGEWCRLYERRQTWARRDHEVLPYHWSDRAKLRRDHHYLTALQESLLVELTAALNSYHDLDRPLRYWRTVLGVWLPTYVAVLFDRWECLRVAFESARNLSSVALPASALGRPAPDCNGFIDAAAYSPRWNHELYLRIIRAEWASRCELRPVADAAADAAAPPEAPTARGLKAGVLAAAGQLDAMMGRLFTRSRVALITSYFPLGALVKLNLALGQVPRLYAREFEVTPDLAATLAATARATDRARLRLAWPAAAGFEAFLAAHLVKDIPVAYVEGFPALLRRAQQIRICTRVICSANAHWSNELFKVWSAEQIVNGTKFVALTHGGGLPLLIDQTMCFEEKISDKMTTWTIPYRPKHVQMPPNKRVSQRIRSSRQYCTVVTQETPLHPFRASAGPIGVGVLETVRLVGELFNGLEEGIRAAFRVKPYRNLGWNTRQRISDAIGAERIFPDQRYEQCLAQSRVVVCTYPQTTLVEAMASGLPTLLVYLAEFWETIPEVRGLLDVLRAAGLLYDQPQAAAAHLNRIWADPDAWWQTPAVVQARQQFNVYCLDLDKRWLARWTGFLRQMAA
jgi:putative transferase (TIGR04331 family)